MCVHSGYCCRVRPCQFGESLPDKPQCKHLTADNKCGIYERIIALPTNNWYAEPAFGAGCCSPLNSDRDAMLRADPDLAERVRRSSVEQYAERRRYYALDEKGA